MLNSFRVVFVGNQVVVEPVSCDYGADNMFFSFDYGMTGENSHLGGTKGAAKNYSHDARTLNDIVKKYGSSSYLYNAITIPESGDAYDNVFAGDYNCERYSMQRASATNPAWWGGDIRLGGPPTDSNPSLWDSSNDRYRNWPSNWWQMRDHFGNAREWNIEDFGNIQSASGTVDINDLRTINNGVFSQFWQEDFRCPTDSSINSISDGCKTGFFGGAFGCEDCPGAPDDQPNVSDIPCARCETSTEIFGAGMFDTDVRNYCIDDTGYLPNASYSLDAIVPNGPVHPSMTLSKRQFELYSAAGINPDGFFGRTYKNSIDRAYYLPSWYSHRDKWTRLEDGFGRGQTELDPRSWFAELGYSPLASGPSNGRPSHATNPIAHWEIFDEDGNYRTEFRVDETSEFDIQNYVGSRPYEGLPPMNYQMISDSMWWWPDHVFNQDPRDFSLGNSTTYLGRPHWFDLPDTSIKCASDFFALDGGLTDGSETAITNQLGFAGGRLVGPYKYKHENEIYTMQCFMVLDPEAHWDTINGEWTCDPDVEECKTCFLNDYGNGFASALYPEDVDNQGDYSPGSEELEIDLMSKHKFINRAGTEYFDYASALEFEQQFGESCDDDQNGPYGLGCFTYPLKFIAGDSATGRKYLENTSYRNPDGLAPKGITGQYDQTIDLPSEANWTYDTNATETYDDIGNPDDKQQPPFYTDRVVCTGSMSIHPGSNHVSRDQNVSSGLRMEDFITVGPTDYQSCVDPCGCYNRCGCYTWGSNPVTGISDALTCSQYMETFSRYRALGNDGFDFAFGGKQTNPNIRPIGGTNTTSSIVGCLSDVGAWGPGDADGNDWYWIRNCDSLSECALAVDVDTRDRHQSGRNDLPGDRGFGPYVPLTKWAALHGSRYNQSEYEDGNGNLRPSSHCHRGGQFDALILGDDPVGPFWDFNEIEAGTNDAGDPYYFGSSCTSCRDIRGETVDITESLNGNVSVSNNYNKTQIVVIDPNDPQYSPSADRWPIHIFLGVIGAGGPGGACKVQVDGCNNSDLFDYQRLCLNGSGFFETCYRQGEAGAEGGIILRTCKSGIDPKPLIIKVEKLGKGGLESWSGEPGVDVDTSTTFPSWEDRETKISVYEVDNLTSDPDALAVESNRVISVTAEGGRAVAISRAANTLTGCGQLVPESDEELEKSWGSTPVPRPGLFDSIACGTCLEGSSPPPLRLGVDDGGGEIDPCANPIDGISEGDRIGACACDASQCVCTTCIAACVERPGGSVEILCSNGFPRCDDCLGIDGELVEGCCQCAHGEPSTSPVPGACNDCGDSCGIGGGGGGGGGGGSCGCGSSSQDPPVCVGNCGDYDLIPCCFERSDGSSYCVNTTPYDCERAGGKRKDCEACVTQSCRDLGRGNNDICNYQCYDDETEQNVCARLIEEGYDKFGKPSCRAVGEQECECENAGMSFCGTWCCPKDGECYTDERPDSGVIVGCEEFGVGEDISGVGCRRFDDQSSCVEAGFYWRAPQKCTIGHCCLPQVCDCTYANSTEIDGDICNEGSVVDELYPCCYNETIGDTNTALICALKPDRVDITDKDGNVTNSSCQSVLGRNRFEDYGTDDLGLVFDCADCFDDEGGGGGGGGGGEGGGGCRPSDGTYWCSSNPTARYKEVTDTIPEVNPPRFSFDDDAPKWSSERYTVLDSTSGNAFGQFDDSGIIGIDDVHTWHELAGNIDTELVTYNSIDDRYEVKYDVRISEDELGDNQDGYNFVDINGVWKSPHSHTDAPWGGKNDENTPGVDGWSPNDPTPNDFPMGIIWRLGKTYIFDQSPATDDFNPDTRNIGCGTRAIYFGSTRGAVEGANIRTNDAGNVVEMFGAPWVDYVVTLRDPNSGDEFDWWFGRQSGQEGNTPASGGGYRHFQDYQNNWDTFTLNAVVHDVVARKVIFTVPEDLDVTIQGRRFGSELYRRTHILDSNGNNPWVGEDAVGPTIDDIVRANRYAANEDSFLEHPEWDDSDHAYTANQVEEFAMGTGTYSLVIRMGFAVGGEGNIFCLNEDGYCDGGLYLDDSPIIGPLRPSRSKRLIKPGVGGCGSMRLLEDADKQRSEGGGANGGGAFISWGQTVNDVVTTL